MGRWRHKSPASRLFIQPFIQTQIKENIKASRHRWPVNSPRKWPVTRKMFPFDDVIMIRLVYALASDDGLTTQGADVSATMKLTHLP